MATVFFKQAKENQKKYKNLNYKPKLIFAELENQFNKLLALSFFLMIMTSEILLNQPIKKKIGLIHNNPIYKFLFRNYEKLERIETNSFAFSFFMILQKLFKEEEALEKFSEELIQYTVCHWVIINKMNEKQYTKKLKDIIKLWNKNKEIVMSKNEEKKIDLIFLLYKSFEIGIGDKEIIKKNIAVLGFSISKVFKEFRYDVLNEFNKKRV